MEWNIKNMSIIALLVSCLISGVCVANYVVNIQSEHHYLSEINEVLREAKKQAVFELKMENVLEALEMYRSGISQQNLVGLESLISCNSAEEMDYWLPKMISAIDAEQTGLNFPPRTMALAALLLGFLITSAHGTFSKPESWDTDERHIYITLLWSLGLAIFVGFIP